MPKAKKKVKDLDPKGQAKKVKGGRTYVQRDTERVRDLVVKGAQGAGSGAGRAVSNAINDAV